MEMLKNLLKNH